MRAEWIAAGAALWIGLPAHAQNVGIGNSGCTYATLASALASAGANDIIRISSAAPPLVEGGYTLVADVTIETGDASCLASSTVAPATIEGGGVLGPITVASGATVTMSNLILSSHTGGDGGSLHVDGTLVLEDVIVEDGSAARGGAVFVHNGALETRGASQIRQSSAGDGGGLYVDTGGSALLGGDTLVMLNDATIGGGVFVAGALTLEDSASIRLNSATSNGGGAYVLELGTLDALCASCSISLNDANNYGGGIFAVSGSVVDLVFTDISGNSAGLAGGGVHTTDDFEMGYGELTFNRADVGGGINGAGRVYLSDVNVANNDATSGDGGGLRMFTEGTLRMWYVEFDRNEASSSGGGLHLSGEITADLHGTWIHDNDADVDGGGLAIVGAVDLTAQSCWFHGNSAIGDGGGILIDGDDAARPIVHLDGGQGHQCQDSPVVPGFNQYCSEIRGNSADRGGGMHLRSGDVTVERTAFLANLATTNSLAVHLENDDAPALTMVNVLVADHLGAPGQAVVRVGNGTALDGRHVTMGGNTGTPLQYRPTAAGQWLRSIVWGGDDVLVEMPSLTATCSSFDGVVGTLTGSAVNYPEDPVFATTVRGDYRLDPILSPSVDRCNAGNPVDLDSLPRFAGLRYDRGAFEMQ